MGLPIAFSEELWELGKTLPSINLIILCTLSIVIQSFYTYFSLFQGKESRLYQIVFRVFLNYFLTLLTVAIILIVLNRLNAGVDFYIGIRRVLILSFPASLGAVIVDGLDKE